MAENRSRELKVGVFVTGLLLAMAGSIFVVGGSSDMLEDRYTLYGSWADVAGMKEGAVVRLAGWDVGEVAAIRFSDDLGVKELFVELKIRDRYRSRIRQDSEARIDTVGVLGDKYVAISMGDPGERVLEDGDWIRTRPPLDFLEYQKKVSSILESTSSIGNKVDLMLGEDSEAAKASLARSFEHLEKLLQAAESGDGLLHALVYDEGMTRRVEHTLANLEVMSDDLRAVTTEIRTGDGMANELIYGQEGKALAQELSQLASALSELTADIKSDESLLHAIVYDPEKARLLDDLAATASAMRETSEAINSGDGTLGLLARDPALYEDLRALVGGAQRNKLLRAYLRQTVKKGEETNAGPWEPAP